MHYNWQLKSIPAWLAPSIFYGTEMFRVDTLSTKSLSIDGAHCSLMVHFIRVTANRSETNQNPIAPISNRINPEKNSGINLM